MLPNKPNTSNNLNAQINPDTSQLDPSFVNHPQFQMLVQMCRNNPQLPQQFLSRINTPNLFSPQLPQQNPQTCTRTPTLNLPKHSKTTQLSPSQEGSNSKTPIPSSPSRNGSDSVTSNEESSPSRDGSDSETSDEEFSSESQPSQLIEDALQINSPQLNQTQFNMKWTVDEDNVLLSAFMMSGVDQLKGTDETSRDKWVNIMRDFELARQGNPYNIKRRKLEAIKSRWRRMNLSMKKWVDVYAEAKKQKGSNSSEADILAEAHRMYQGCSNGARFTFEHPWNIMKQYRNWQGSTNQFPCDSSGSSGNVGEVIMKKTLENEQESVESLEKMRDENMKKMEKIERLKKLHMLMTITNKTAQETEEYHRMLEECMNM